MVSSPKYKEAFKIYISKSILPSKLYQLLKYNNCLLNKTDIKYIKHNLVERLLG